MACHPRLSIPRPATRWAFYGATVALALVAVRITERSEAPPASAPGHVLTERREAAPGPAQANLVLDLGRLALRAHPSTVADPFDARSWDALTAEEARRNAPAPPPPPPRQAPQLPFAFMGKLIDEDRVTVFLTNGERNWVVRAGDTIDGSYRVESVGDQRMTLTHLALQLSQELAIGESATRPGGGSAALPVEALPAADVPRATAPVPGRVSLLFAAPSRVAVGTELVVSVGLAPASGARSAQVELGYDAKVLSSLGDASHEPGRVRVALTVGSVPLAQLRFRVIAQGPTTTQIGIERAAAADALGANLSVTAPGRHSIAIVRAGG